MNSNCATVSQKNMAASFAKSLPKLRKKYNVTQTKLGNYIGLSRQTISAIERNTVPLAWDTCLAMILFFTKNDENAFKYIKDDDFLNCLEELLKLSDIPN
ncbi:helix-turn-helix domain-containing protein [Proteiniborus sp.]|uniref:helix-turn-helix transcriptional regulator n=1 Tax=Proteiniborus sp. TaxID=2079015 RepID=UPI003319DDB9